MLERLPLLAASGCWRRMDALNISNPRAVTCLRPRPGSGVRLPGGGPGALPLLGRSRRAQPRLEPSAHLSHTLPSMPRAPLCTRPGALSCSSSLSPCPMADELGWLTPLAGLFHRQPPGSRPPQRAERRASDLVAAQRVAAATTWRHRSAWPHGPALAFGQGSRGVWRSPGQCALAEPRLSQSGLSVGRSWLSTCCIALVELACVSGRVYHVCMNIIV